jgi:hypothetical protein
MFRPLRRNSERLCWFDLAASLNINMTEIFPRRNVVPNPPLQFLDLGKAALIFS